MKRFLKTLRLTALLRGHYFEFMKMFKNSVREIGAETLNFVALWAVFMALFDELDKIMRPIRKSELTPELVELDRKRDKLFSGLKKTVEGALNNFAPATVQAAKKLMIIFDTYGNVTKESSVSETGDIYNAVNDLRTKCAAELMTLNLTSWVTELDKANKEFENLWSERNIELNNEQPPRKFEEVEKDLDYYYDLFIDHLEWQMNIEPSEAVKKFVYGWNGVIQKYKNIIAQHEGILDAEKEEEIEEDN